MSHVKDRQEEEAALSSCVCVCVPVCVHPHDNKDENMHFLAQGAKSGVEGVEGVAATGLKPVQQYL